jgi:bifunctional non-homologous end joining protein LigD
MALKEYRAKRDFKVTPEPAPRPGKKHAQPIFVIQEHHARRLHYDFRLEADSVLKSWAVPKVPTLDPSQKRLAVHVEDHPLDYAYFQGQIPKGQYGAGDVSIWDHGTYENLLAQKKPPMTVTQGIAAGRVEVLLHGKKLKGRFALVRLHGRDGGKDNWLLIKMKDEFARPGSATESNGAAKAAGPTTSAPKKGRAKASAAAAQRKMPVLTHPDKIIFPESGITKAEVFEFYKKIAPRLLPHLRDRPATLERLPEGVTEEGPHFWQKNAPEYYPSWIQRAELPTKDGRVVQYVLVNNIETLLYLVNQGTLTFHVWFSRIQDLARPDFVLFDLDPGPAKFADVVDVANALHGLLSKEKIKAVVKTSGKTGLHVLTPWEGKGGYDEARAWALARAERLVEVHPDRATVERSKAKRGGRVYVDVMQNALGHHAVPPYVLRAVPAASVSTPLDWREVTPELDPRAFNLKTVFRRLAKQKKDPAAALVQ